MFCINFYDMISFFQHYNVSVLSNEVNFWQGYSEAV